MRGVRAKSMKQQALVITVCAVFVSACSDMCSNEIMQTVMSPSGSSRAVVFSRDCGATTGFSTQVSILPDGRELPNDGGNVLVLGDIVPLNLAWKSNSSLQVSGLGGRKTFMQATSVSGVAISYAN
jgi:hypothetical protein